MYQRFRWLEPNLDLITAAPPAVRMDEKQHLFDVELPSAPMEGVELMTHPAASQQGATQTFYQHGPAAVNQRFDVAVTLKFPQRVFTCQVGFSVLRSPRHSLGSASTFLCSSEVTVRSHSG